jgi:hypothetical protein
MARVDLHVYSKFSHHASEWFLKKLGAYESYTEPEAVYLKARSNGMHFFTLTGHNRIEGALALQAAHPREVFTGLEATTYFPEDGCKIHLLVYGLNRQQFEQIELLRPNIYALRDYIRAEDLAYSVAHATYSVNDRLTRSHIEKLLLLFDVFEGINGSRDKMSNQGWSHILKNLTPQRLEALHKKHGIEPISDDPWIKGLTAGSDDHANLFIGATWTEAGARTPEDFLYCIKDKLTHVGGRHNNYRAFVFTIYKIAYDFSKSNQQGLSRSLISQLNELLFNGKPLPIASRIKMAAQRWSRGSAEDSALASFQDLVALLRRLHGEDLPSQFDAIFDRLSDIADGFVKNLLRSFDRDLGQGDIVQLARSVSSLMPAVSLSALLFQFA